MDKEPLAHAYLIEKKSVRIIADELGCSEHKVNYWLTKHGIPKRSIAEAVYAQCNPQGDPFSTHPIRNCDDAFLFGLGLGLYWGEGTKKSLSAVRLGNTDPYLVRAFLLFLRKRYSIHPTRLRFGLQIFSDMDVGKEMKFWQRFLHFPAAQFYKPIVTRSGSIGTYREKSAHGVLTVYFNNRKLRDVLIGEIEKMRHLQ